MSLRIKAVVDKFVKELKEALDADIQDRIMKEREMQSYIEEREREVAEREAAWKAELSRRELLLHRECPIIFMVQQANNQNLSSSWKLWPIIKIFSECNPINYCAHDVG
ncbi:uncharacterized protein LOC122008662 isoform X3 [Zingiber officinale]|uniref:uncharacterized protein LOC122008662 isoform X3 n=1 Tax=Zingiber officinale TaxID=94328 RepID=UPI001C4AC673|nr:uncharacterized protein LOC122008662 isoform X3 [Zingiber officinale]